jgi:triacylglycerol lipase
MLFCPARVSSRKWLPAFAALPTLLLAQHAPSPPSPAAEHARAGVAALGRNWNADVLAATTRLYLPLHQQRGMKGITRTAGIAYGRHAQQKLDLFVPEQGFSEPGPVFVFLHGGAATGGDKSLAGTDEQMFGNVARLAARVGGVGINANYRISAKAKGKAPAGAEDMRQLIGWTRSHIAAHGGDPDAIIVFALGDGAARLAGYLFHEPSQLQDGPGIAGAILVSGTFGTAKDRPLSLIGSYQGKAVPLMLWSAGLDPLQSGIGEMKDLLCSKHGKCPMHVELAGHNHVSHVMSLDTADTSALGSIHQFYHSVVRK